MNRQWRFVASWFLAYVLASPIFLLHHWVHLAPVDFAPFAIQLRRTVACRLPRGRVSGSSPLRPGVRTRLQTCRQRA
jgi:hypothetical protein